MVAARGDTMAGELILMIEDNPLNAKLVRDVLVASGYQLVERTTAEEGLQLARERKPALILMDIRLPGMDGNAAHGDVGAQMLAARRQRDAERPAGGFGVIEEQLVEIAHAVEDEHIRVICLDTQVLLHHRRVDRTDVRAHSCFFVGD